MDRGAQPVQRLAVLQVARHQRRFRSQAADLVVQLLQGPLRPAERDHVRARPGEVEADRAPDAACRARDEGDALVEGFVHDLISSPARQDLALLRAGTSG